MNRYWKAWGALIGAGVGVAAAYGLVPAGADLAVTQALNTLGPIIGGAIGAFLAPRNAS